MEGFDQAERRFLPVAAVCLFIIFFFAVFPAEATRSVSGVFDSTAGIRSADFRRELDSRRAEIAEGAAVASTFRLFPWLSEPVQKAQYPPYAFALKWVPDNPAQYQIDPAGSHSYHLTINLNLSGAKAGGARAPGIDFNRLGRGELIKEYVPDAQRLSSTQVGNDRFLHGRPYVSALGLYDHRARFYDPETLSFLQPDPLGPVDSPNLYQGFGFDALNVTDPWGMKSCAAGTLPKWLCSMKSSMKASIDAEMAQLDSDIGEIAWWTKTLIARPGVGAIGWYKTAGEGAFGLGLLATDVGATYVGLSVPGTDERLAGVADFFSHPVDNTIASVSGQWNRMVASEQAGDWVRSSEIAGSLAFQTYATVEGVAGLSRAGIGIANRFTPAVVANEVPARVARVFSSRYLSGSRLAHPSATEAWITAADDIAGISSAEELARRLTLVDESGELIPGPYAVIEFDLPDGVASPVFRDSPGFVGRGRTAGGAREFVIPNYSLEELLNPTKKVVE